MRRAKIKHSEESAETNHSSANHSSADHSSNDGPAHNMAVAGTDFMLSMVEEHDPRNNGNSNKMDSGLKAQQELTKIEGQITRLQSEEGQSSETVRQIEQLNERVNDLRREISSLLNAWQRTELARHP